MQRLNFCKTTVTLTKFKFIDQMLINFFCQKHFNAFGIISLSSRFKLTSPSKKNAILFRVYKSRTEIRNLKLEKNTFSECKKSIILIFFLSHLDPNVWNIYQRKMLVSGFSKCGLPFFNLQNLRWYVRKFVQISVY